MPPMREVACHSVCLEFNLWVLRTAFKYTSWLLSQDVGEFQSSKCTKYYKRTIQKRSVERDPGNVISHSIPFLYTPGPIHPNSIMCPTPYNLLPTKLPPSNAIVAPLTKAPALLLKNRHAPATSCGLPILPSGMPLTIASPKFFSVAAIILLSNGPHARALLVIFLFPK